MMNMDAVYYPTHPPLFPTMETTATIQFSNPKTCLKSLGLSMDTGQARLGCLGLWECSYVGVSCIQVKSAIVVLIDPVWGQDLEAVCLMVLSPCAYTGIGLWGSALGWQSFYGGCGKSQGLSQWQGPRWDPKSGARSLPAALAHPLDICALKWERRKAMSSSEILQILGPPSRR